MMRHLWVAALALIIIGTVLAGAGFALGATGAIIWDHGFKVIKSDEIVTVTETNLEGVTSLEINAISEDITFTAGDSWGFTARTYWSEIEWSLEGGTLKIGNVRHNRKIMFMLPFGRRGNDYGIKITYPSSSANLSSIKINTVSGNIVLKAPFVTDKIALNTTSGDVSLDQIKANALTIDTVSGNVNLQNAAAQTFSFDSTSGDLSTREIQTVSLTANTISGNLSLFGGISTGNFDTVSGDLYIDGMFGGGKIETVSGNIKINTGYDSSEFSGNAQSRSGNIVIDGRRAEKKTHLAGSGRELNISSTSGNITVTFGL